MPLTDAQKKAVRKWNSANYTQLGIFVGKEEAPLIKEHAKEMCESLNGFVNRAMQETMKRDKEKLDQK